MQYKWHRCNPLFFTLISLARVMGALVKGATHPSPLTQQGVPVLPNLTPRCASDPKKHLPYK